MIFAYKEEEGIKGREEGREGKVGGKIGFSHFDIKLIQVGSKRKYFVIFFLILSFVASIVKIY